jgi:hypothetical protein
MDCEKEIRPGRCIILKVSREGYNDRGHPACRVWRPTYACQLQGSVRERTLRNIFVPGFLNDFARVPRLMYVRGYPYVLIETLSDTIAPHGNNSQFSFTPKFFVPFQRSQ